MVIEIYISALEYLIFHEIAHVYQRHSTLKEIHEALRHSALRVINSKYPSIDDSIRIRLEKESGFFSRRRFSHFLEIMADNFAINCTFMNSKRKEFFTTDRHGYFFKSFNMSHEERSEFVFSSHFSRKILALIGPSVGLAAIHCDDIFALMGSVTIGNREIKSATHPRTIVRGVLGTTRLLREQFHVSYEEIEKTKFQVNGVARAMRELNLLTFSHFATNKSQSATKEGKLKMVKILDHKYDKYIHDGIEEYFPYIRYFEQLRKFGESRKKYSNRKRLAFSALNDFKLQTNV